MSERKRKHIAFSHELNARVHRRIPGDIVTMMALSGWNAFGVYEIVDEEMRREKAEKKSKRTVRP